MTSESILALIDRWRGAWTRRDAVSLATTYADNCVLESPMFGTVIGRAAIQQSFHRWFTAFPDARIEFGDPPLITGDRVVETFTAAGTDTGGLLGEAPTGRAFRIFIVRLCEVTHGKIVHERRVFDVNGLLLQLAKGDDVAVEASRQYRAARAAAILEHEIKVAAEIQRALLPASDYRGRGFDVASASLPCRAIGGDFLDCFDLGDGMFGFVVGDVAGKGPPAALLAARMQGILAASANASAAPSHTVTLINQELGRRSVEAHFATLLYGVLSCDGRLTFCNAGHNPALVVGRRGVRRLTTGGVPLGVFRDAVFEQETVQLDYDDVLVVFTDGVIEALNSDGAEFGEDRLLALLSADRALAPATLLDRVMTAVRDFTANVEQHDDITAFILRYGSVAAVAGASVLHGV